jgi:hypothetical protein
MALDRHARMRESRDLRRTVRGPAMTGVLVAVCRVHALLPDRGNGVTAIAP